MATIPRYRGRLDPVYPCRVMVTRHCPAVYDAVCGEARPCARYESEDVRPWIYEISEVEVMGMLQPFELSE